MRALIGLVLLLCAACRAQPADIAIGTFLEVNYELSRSKEPYMHHAYRMALAEANLGSKLADLDFEAIKSAVEAVLVPTAPANFLSLEMPFYGVTLHLDIVDVGEMSDEEIDAAMAGWSSRRSGMNQYILGGHSSSSERKKAQWCKDNKILFISPGAASTDIFSNTNFAFGLLASTYKLGQTTMEFLQAQVENGKLTDPPYKIALLYEDAKHGEDYRDGVTDFAATHPELFSVEFMKRFPLREFMEPAQFQNITNPMFAQIESEGGDWLLLIDSHSEDFRLLQENLAHHDFDFKAITHGARGTDASDLQQLAESANNEVERRDYLRSVKRLFAGLWWSPGQQSSASIEFVNGWRKHEAVLWIKGLEEREANNDESFLFSKPSEQLTPAWFGATGYEAMKLLLQALQNTAGQGANSFIRSAVRTAILEIDMPTILPGGTLSFPSTGPRQVENTFSIAQNQIANESDISAFMDVEVDELFPLIAYPPDQAGAEFFVMPPFGFTRPSCERENYQFIVGECQLDTYREITTLWYDRNGQLCPSAVSCFCDAVNSNVRVPDVRCNYIPLKSKLARTLFTLAAIGIIAGTISLIALSLWNREGKMTGLRFYSGIAAVVSVIITNGSIFLLVGAHSNAGCTGQLWANLLGLAPMQSLLFGRIFYWYRVWTEPTQATYSVSAFVMFLPSIFAFSGFLVLVIAWTIHGSPFYVTEVVDNGIVEPYVDAYCAFDRNGAAPAIASLAYLGFLLLLSLALVYQSREVDGKFFESWYLWLGTVNFVFVFAVVGVLFGLVDLSVDDQLFLVGVALFWSSMGFLFTAIFPRASAILGIRLFTANKNTGTSSSRNISEEGKGTTDSAHMVAKYIHGRHSKKTNTGTNPSRSRK